MPVSDFDFVFGAWNVHNRRLRDHNDPAETEWIEFDARGEAFPVLAGTGNVDRMWVEDSPIGTFEGFTLRLHNPADDTWSIWWSDTGEPGVLDEPVVGRFTDGIGRFETVQRISDADVLVRFEWIVADVQWRQSFSWDGGANFTLNWVMDFRPTTP